MSLHSLRKTTAVAIEETVQAAERPRGKLGTNVPGLVATAQDERNSVAPPPAHDPAITAQANSDPSHGTKAQPSDCNTKAKACPKQTSKVKGAKKSTRKGAERAKRWRMAITQGANA